MDLNSPFLGKTTYPLVAPTQDEKNIAILTYAVSFVSSFVGPLVIYLVKKDESSFVAAHAKTVLNFHLTLLFYAFISAALVLILIGFVFLWLLGIAAVVYMLLGLVAAIEGKLYATPFTFRFIS